MIKALVSQLSCCLSLFSLLVEDSQRVLAGEFFASRSVHPTMCQESIYCVFQPKRPIQTVALCERFILRFLFSISKA